MRIASYSFDMLFIKLFNYQNNIFQMDSMMEWSMGGDTFPVEMDMEYTPLLLRFASFHWRDG